MSENPVMTRRELIGGLCFLPVYQLLLYPLVRLLCAAAGLQNAAVISLFYYLVCVGILCLLFHRFLKSELSGFFRGEKKRKLLSFLTLLALYYAIAFCVGLLLRRLYPDFSNSNDEAVTARYASVPVLFALISVVLAPFTEECLFRALIFGNLRYRSRAAAYAVSVLVFTFVHLLGYLPSLTAAELFCSLLQYIPAAWILCRLYEKTENLFYPVLLHGCINLVSMLAFYLNF